MARENFTTTAGKPVSLPGLAHTVAGMLQAGRENALSRQQLIKYLRDNPIFESINDGDLRGAIGELREAGELVCSMGINDGYYLAGDLREYTDFKAKYQSYATTIFARVRQMDKTAAQRFGEAYTPQLL